MLKKMKGLLQLASVSTLHRYTEQILGHSYDDQNIMHATYTVSAFFGTSMWLTPTN